MYLFGKIFNVTSPNTGSYYDAIEKSKFGLVIENRFYQGGSGLIFSGYLGAGGGTCAFTVLDFFRAATQNCLKEWFDHTRSTLITSEHASRQRYLYLNRHECCNDPAFNVTLNNKTPDDGGYMQRENIFALDGNNPPLAKFARQIYLAYVTYLQSHLDARQGPLPLSVFAPCFELTFDLTVKNRTERHSVGFVLEPPGNQMPPTLMFMDPNAGAIRVPLKIESIMELLDILNTKLYEEFIISNMAIQQKLQSWIENVTPILNGETKKIEREIHGTGTIGLKKRAIVYSTKLLEQPKYDKNLPSPIIAIDDEESSNKEQIQEPNNEMIKNPEPKEKAYPNDTLYYEYNSVSNSQTKNVVRIDISEAISELSEREEYPSKKISKLR